MTSDNINIGIDTGVHTGIAIMQGNELLLCKSVNILSAIVLVFNQVKRNSRHHNKYSINVYIEDARLRKWYGERSNSKQQGAGSVKRDAKIWEELSNDLKGKYENVHFHFIHPRKNGTKLTREQVLNMTGHVITNEHARDALMIIYGR